MEKARGGSRKGVSRPQNEGATQSKVTVFLGRDEEAIELKGKLDDILYHELNQSGQLKDTINLIYEHFR